MAEFCKKCAEKLLGKDTPSDFIDCCKGYECLKVLCEGCGEYIIVNNKGERIDD